MCWTHAFQSGDLEEYYCIFWGGGDELQSAASLPTFRKNVLSASQDPRVSEISNQQDVGSEQSIAIAIITVIRID
jgi:hypothetical protein